MQFLRMRRRPWGAKFLSSAEDGTSIEAQIIPRPFKLAVAVGLGFAGNEIGGRYPLKIVIADEAGVPVVPELNGQIETGQLAPDLPQGLPVKVPVAWNVSFGVPRPGKYTIVVTVGTAQADLTFDAIFVGQRVQFAPESSVPPAERGN